MNYVNIGGFLEKILSFYEIEKYEVISIVSHVVDIKQFDRDTFELVFDETDRIFSEPKTTQIDPSRWTALLFFEPSTRTAGSFELASIRNGLYPMHSADPERSSVKKGESLHDTLTMMVMYEPQMVIMRHPQAGSARFGSEILDRYGIPLINGGDDGHQHPTQTLLDMYTIRKAYGGIDGLNIALMGDHKHGRTVTSLVEGLVNYDVAISFIAPDVLQMTHRPEVLRYLKEKGVDFNLLDKPDLALPYLDVLYVTRVQKERFDDPGEYKTVADSYVIGQGVLKKLRENVGNVSIMHPLPRIREIRPEVDDTTHNLYFQQAANGLPVRTALMHLLLNGELELEPYLAGGNEVTGCGCLNPRCITYVNPEDPSSNDSSDERLRGFVEPRFRVGPNGLIHCEYCDNIQTESGEPYRWS